MRMLGCRSKHTLQESVLIRQEFSGLLVLICCTALYGAKQRHQVRRPTGEVWRERDRKKA